MKPGSPIGFVIWSIVAAAASADDWPQYLGPGRDAIWREAGVALDLEQRPPRLVWSKPIGGGYSGPAVAGGRVFVMDRLAEPHQPGEIEPGTNLNFVRAEIPGRERVLCLDESSGEAIWSREYPATYTSAFIYAIGPRATPLVHDGVVYTLGAEGHLHAYSAEGGALLWSIDLLDEFEFENPEWGTAAHPLVHRDLLICTVGGEGSTVVAFDRKNGEERWRALSARQPGYGTPVVGTINGLAQLLVWHSDSVNALNPDTGEVYWSVPFKPEFGMAIGAPRVWEDLVYVMGFNGKSGAIRVAKDNRSAELIWGPDLRLGVAGVLNTAYVRDGYAYSAGRRGLFRCARLDTGERVWEAPEPLLKADGSGRGGWQSAFTVHHQPSGRTLIFNDHGEMIVARLSPDGYREESRVPIIEPTHSVSGRMLVWSHPALANRRVYCRNDKQIRCYEFARPAGRKRLEEEPISGLVVAKDASGMTLRNAAGEFAVRFSGDTRFALEANTRLLAKLEEGVLRYPIHSSSQVLDFALPPGPISGIVSVRNVGAALESAERERWIAERGLRLIFGEQLPERMPTVADPRFIGRWDPFADPRTLTVHGVRYELSLKRGGQANALLFGVMDAGGCKPFAYRASVIGHRRDGDLHADEVHLLPVGDQTLSDDPGLPRYLFIGDSISGNYARGLRRRLEGKLNVHHPPTNCGSSAKGRGHIVEWLGAYERPGRHWDVISFNFGHWDASADKETYQQNLEAVITQLAKTRAKLIWVTTCPVPSGFPPAGELEGGGSKAPGRKTGVMQRHLNPWALEVLGRYPEIEMCDQWALVRDRGDDLYREWWQGKDVHFAGEQADALGELLADRVLEVTALR